MTTTDMLAAPAIELAAPAWLTEIPAADGIRMFQRMDTDDVERAMQSLIRQVWGNADHYAAESGRYRSTYLFETTVMKIPVHGSGWNAHAGACSSLLEVQQYMMGGYDDGHGTLHPIAACRIVWHESGLPVVIMERIDVVGESAPAFSHVPDWSGIVDNHQVGYNARTAQWEIYDAGCEPGDTGPAWDVIDNLDAFEPA